MKREVSRQSQQPSEETRQAAHTATPALAPGKQTRSGRLPAAPAGAPAVVQRKAAPAGDAAQAPRDETTDQWLDTAVRPDLFPPPVQRKAANDKTAGLDAQMGDIAQENGATQDERVGTEEFAPFAHPYYQTFKARVLAVFARVPPPEGKTPDDIATDTWRKVWLAMRRSQPVMGNAATPDEGGVYSNPSRGYVDMNADAFQGVLGQFEGVLEMLRGYLSSQFASARSFGFWSTGVGRALSEHISDLTLETSGIGVLFDGIPSIDKVAKCGWDVHLWGALSHAYGVAVGDQIQQEGKRVHVCLGPGARRDNIFAAVESKAIEAGAGAVGKTLKEVCTFHAAAPTKKWGAALDTSVGRGEFDGTVYSGDEDTARQKADEYNASLSE